MSAAAIPLCFKLNFTPVFPSRTQHSHLSYPDPSSFSNHCNLICFAFSPSNSSSSSSGSGGEKPLDYGSQEEARWLREEQRWLREEQRWLREESRWNEEREALLREIQRLKSLKQEPERMNFVQESLVPELTATNISKVLQFLKEGELAKTMNRIPESGSSAQPIVLNTTIEEEKMVLKEIIDVSQQMEKKVKKRATLRIGSEGEDVKSMQEALEKQGFYSGEEDMEFSSFSSGTERAVKTWQSTLGAPEDGIMTSELLELLYEQKLGSPSFLAQKETNGAAMGSTNDTSKVGKTEVKIAEHRVYLIGENRWEEPSRLSGRMNSPGSNISSSQALSSRCPSCRGEGKMLCMECEGTGEPNIEPQFMEWIGEGTQCAYCDGLGYVTCDVCDGRKTNDA